MLFFDKLNFSQTLSLYRGFQHYVLLGKQSLKNDVRCNLFKSAVEMADLKQSLQPLESIGTLEAEGSGVANEMELSSVFTPPPVLMPFPHTPATPAAPAADTSVMELSSVLDPVLTPGPLFPLVPYTTGMHLSNLDQYY
jgi:hypothetical protein